MKISLCLSLAAGVLLLGCGESSDKPAQPTNAAASGSSPLSAPADYVGALGKAQQTAVKTADTATLNQAIQMFNVEKGRNPKDLNELVEKKVHSRASRRALRHEARIRRCRGKGQGGQAVTEQIVILDFGSQYTQVIARRVRECNVYSVILRYDTPARGNRAAQTQGHHPVGRPLERLCEDRAVARSRDLRARHPRAGHLLRAATPRPVSRRQGRARPEARIRQRHAARQRQPLPALRRPAEEPAGLELAWRQADQAACRLQIGRRHRELRLRRHRAARPEDVRPAVSPGGGPHAAGRGKSSPISSTASAAAARTGRCRTTSTRPSRRFATRSARSR